MDISQLNDLNLCGIPFPENVRVNVAIINGKKEGVAEVTDDFNNVCARCTFVNDQLSGLALFFEGNELIRKCMYFNNMLNGLCCDYQDGKEIRRFLYENGVLKSKLEAAKGFDGYWKEVDVASNQVLSYYRFNDNLEIHGKVYRFKDDTIERVDVYDNGLFLYIHKEFYEEYMKEFNQEGEIVYIGGFKNSIYLDYPRDGSGEENAKNGNYYSGYWICGLPCGAGVLYDENCNEMYRGFWQNGLYKIDDDTFYSYAKQCIIKEVVTTITEEQDFAQLTENTTRLIFAPKACSNRNGHLSICNYPNLRTIQFSAGALQTLSSLEIRNNSMLTVIVFEDCEPEDGVLLHAKSVVIRGRCGIRFQIDLPRLETFSMGTNSLQETTELVLESMCVFFTIDSIYLYFASYYSA